ncbi:TRAP transporter large permease [Chloroflexota bacterium]
MNIAGLLSLFGLTFLGIPIYLAIFAAGLIILVLGYDVDPTTTIQVMFERLTSDTLIAIPMFILMGHLLAVGGSGKPLARLLNAFMGHIPGGPAYALILGNVIVAAMCASPIAGIAAFGPIMVPMMVEMGYSERFSIGLLICSSVLAPLIPPSILPIIYSFIAGQALTQYAASEGGVVAGAVFNVDVRTLWTASILPGVMLAFLLAATVFFHSRRGHFQRLPSIDWHERLLALKDGWAILLMPVVVLGPLYAKWTTPTETSIVGLIYVVLISIFIYRGLNIKGVWGAVSQTAGIIGMVFGIMAGALLLIMALTLSGIPTDLAEWVTDLGLPWYAFMAANVLLFIVLGMFLDPAAIVLICTPLLLPPALDVGVNVYVYGVFMTVAVNLANITPPYGLLLFASVGMLNKPYGYIVRSCLLFLPAMMVGMLIIAFWEDVSLWLTTIIE